MLVGRSAQIAEIAENGSVAGCYCIVGMEQNMWALLVARKSDSDE